MARVTHTVNVVYGSYSIENVKIDSDDEKETIPELQERVKAILDFNYLTTSDCSITIINTVPKVSEY